jgi:hypothetical protein
MILLHFVTVLESQIMLDPRSVLTRVKKIRVRVDRARAVVRSGVDEESEEDVFGIIEAVYGDARSREIVGRKMHGRKREGNARKGEMRRLIFMWVEIGDGADRSGYKGERKVRTHRCI